MNQSFKTKVRRRLLGMEMTDGLIARIAIYLLLAGLGFIFVYPLLFMLVNSLKSLDDLINPTIHWVPSRLAFENYVEAFNVLNLWGRLLDSLQVSILPTIAIILSSSLIGYGLARFRFPGRRLIMVLLVVTYLVPKAVTLVPSYILFSDLGLLKSLSSFILPSLFGQGLYQSIFILILFNFFRMVPRALDEAAQIDGASPFQIFLTIAIPIAKPAFIVVGLYSVVWHWNELYLTDQYLQDAYMTLPQAIEYFKTLFQSSNPEASGVDYSQIGMVYNESVQFAATIISIVPLLVLYLFTQRFFVESADRVGIAGE